MILKFYLAKRSHFPAHGKTWGSQPGRFHEGEEFQFLNGLAEA